MNLKKHNQNINERTAKFFKQMKQLCLDHYGWLKLQTFQKLVASPRGSRTDKKVKPFASMMGSPTPAVRVQMFDLKSEYDIKAYPNLLETSFSHMSQFAAGNQISGSGTKMSLKESLQTLQQLKAV